MLKFWQKKRFGVWSGDAAKQVWTNTLLEDASPTRWQVTGWEGMASAIPGEVWIGFQNKLHGLEQAVQRSGGVTIAEGVQKRCGCSSWCRADLHMAVKVFSSITDPVIPCQRCFSPHGRSRRLSQQHCKVNGTCAGLLCFSQKVREQRHFPSVFWKCSQTLLQPSPFLLPQ